MFVLLGSICEGFDSFLGVCLCRYGVTGSRCEQSLTNRFFPAFDHFILEAEEYDEFLVSNIADYGTVFTGMGFHELQEGDMVNVTFVPPISAG